MTTYYMHTLDGKPAGFYDGWVCFTHKRIPLVASLAQLRREQALSKKNDDGQGVGGTDVLYGYVTVQVPD